MTISCADRLELMAVPGVPLLRAGDDLAAILLRALRLAGIALREGDIAVVTSKAVSRAEGRFVDLSKVVPSARAREVALATGTDERIVEIVLAESVAISRTARDALIVRHRLGFVSANAGVDLSNARPHDAPAASGPWALLLPRDPDGSAAALSRAFSAESGAHIGVVISDSFGRPFRLGSVGVAIGLAGLPALCDLRGNADLFARPLAHTMTALGDQVAAAADLVAGQAAEGRALVLVRGLNFEAGDHRASELLRPADADLYA